MVDPGVANIVAIAEVGVTEATLLTIFKIVSGVTKITVGTLK